ncbi:hypothetical protein HY045_04030 [Candidatus Woesebacteria bacterium]|nr:hypothetical protein [Candidatus Woesebacteria bacterium]
MNQLAQGIFGKVNPPQGVNKYAGGGIEGLSLFINNILKLMIVGASLYALFNFVLAGYSFLSAGDDPKKIEAAWAKIYQSVIGLAFAAGAFVLAAIFGALIFGDPNALLQIRIFTPTP